METAGEAEVPADEATEVEHPGTTDPQPGPGSEPGPAADTTGGGDVEPVLQGCQPDCEGKTCTEADGCGGTCGPCARAVSCEDCPLQLRLVDRKDEEGGLREITLALDLVADQGGALPAIADLRLSVEGPARLRRIGLGEPLLDGAKEPVIDPATGRPFRLLDDGSTQVVLLSTSNTRRIAPGRWLYLRFDAGDSSGPATEPILVRLLRREQTFAPQPADALLWGSRLDQPVVVRPEAYDAQ